MPRHREAAKYKLCKCGEKMNYYQDKCDHCSAKELKKIFKSKKHQQEYCEINKKIDINK